MLEMKQLLLQLERPAEGSSQRILQYLNSQGYKQQFESVEQQLRDSLVQLSGALSSVQFTS
jgi:hypothetical protein